jgi:alpha-D-xyloside xylohydrolase
MAQLKGGLSMAPAKKPSKRRPKRAPTHTLVKTQQGTVKIEVLGKNIVRVLYGLTPDPVNDHNVSLLDPKGRSARHGSVNGRNEVVVRTDTLSVTVSRKDGTVQFFDRAGSGVLRENGRALKQVHACGETSYSIEQRFLWSKGEALFGLGQHQQGIMNYRGHQKLLAQENMEVAVPVFVSSRGYAVLWNNASETRYDGTGKRQWSVWSEVGDVVDYCFIYGPRIDDVIGGIRRVTGDAPLCPRWAFGQFVCKERYRSQKELLDTVGEYRKRGVPMDCIVQDWRYWDPYEWGSHRFGPDRYPDVAGMMKKMHEELGAHVMISVWPMFFPGSENFDQLYKKEYLFWGYEKYGQGQTYYDAFNPAAREMYWNQMNNWLFTKGIDAWWLDATEPELNEQWKGLERRKEVMTNSVSGARYLNAYPLKTTQAVYEGQRKYTSDKRVYILTRSAFTGQQRNAATTWSGDIRGTWDVFRKQISAGLNFCLTGIPYWTTDIGGFFCDFEGGCQNEQYRELFVRWFQFGAFCPIFRIHGTQTPREIWRFGERGDQLYDTLLEFDTLRYRLLPYIYSLGWQVTSASGTIMRALVFDFQDDPRVYGIDDQFMFGPAFLVCPITEPGARNREVYLPSGTQWYDFWTGERHAGGKTIRVASSIETMPLFVRAGSIVPMGPVVQYATEKPTDPIEVRLYTGTDTEFLLYEDENDTYNYEKGAYATIPLSWNERAATLAIGKRSGTFPGMLAKRTFRIVKVGEGRGAGVEGDTRPVAKAAYCGEKVTVRAS